MPPESGQTGAPSGANPGGPEPSQPDVGHAAQLAGGEAAGNTQAPAAEAPPETTARAEPTKGIRTTPLYAKHLGPDHVVELYDFGTGGVAVRESYSIDGGDAPFVRTMGAIQSLAHVYKQLEPTASSPPASIMEADRVSALRRSEAVATPPVLPAPASPAEDPTSTVSAPLSTCSADLFGDGWGGDWFINNFCNQGSFRWCQKNWYRANSGWFRDSWTTWRQLEGDFSNPGHITGEHYEQHWYTFETYTSITVDFDYDVLPRHIEEWVWNGSALSLVMASSPCNHLDVAMLWNN
jgi:hypothetical protein